MVKKRYDTFLAMATYCILITCAISGQNLINVFGLTVTSGMFVFPFTYMFIAASTELYGAQTTRQTIIYCTAANAVMLGVIFLFTQIPSERSAIGSAEVYHAFLNRFSYVLGISTLAFAISENVNVWLLSRLKVLTHGRLFIQRAFLSTVCAVTLDTMLVFPFYFSRQGSFSQAAMEASMVLGMKIFYDIALLPLCWGMVACIKSITAAPTLPQSATPFTSSYYLKQYD